MITRCGIDHRICHPPRQQDQPLTGPPHRVGNRASVTAARSLTANPQGSVSFLPPLAKGRNRPFFPLGQPWECVGNRPVANASNGGAFGVQMYQGGIDRDHRFPQVPRGPTPASMQHGVSESRKGITPSHS